MRNIIDAVYDSADNIINDPTNLDRDLFLAIQGVDTSSTSIVKDGSSRMISSQYKDVSEETLVTKTSNTRTIRTTYTADTGQVVVLQTQVTRSTDGAVDIVSEVV